MKTPIEIVAEVTGRTLAIVTSDRKMKWIKPDEAIRIAEVYHAQFDSITQSESKQPNICLRIGMRVRIKNDTANYQFSAGKIKVITKELPDFGKQRAFELNNDKSIWCIEDFDMCVDYPDAIIV